MRTQTLFKSFLLLSFLAFSALISIHAGEYPRTLTAYRGTTPVLDGYISAGEYADAEWLTGVKGWHSGTNEGIACEDSLDLSVKVWYKHDGSYLYFAFDITDNIVYGFDTERWLPAANADANSLERGVGWPWFGDGLEIMMNPSYTWDETKKSIGDGTIWQTIVSTHKSWAGGLDYGGLIEGVPYTEYAWTNYQNWYENEYMKASVRIKTEEEGSGFVVEWRISPDPCMQISENKFVDLSKESKVGINLEFEDLDLPEDGLGSGNLTEFRHVDFMTELGEYRKNIAKGFATLVLTPEKMNQDELSTAISEDYESSPDLPDSHSINTGTGNEISVQTDKCGNNNLVIHKTDPAEAAEANVDFLWMDKTVYSSFDITTEQTGSDIRFDLGADGQSLVKVSLEDDSIRYYQEGSYTAWKKYEANTKYRIQIAADIQAKKFSLDVNGDVLTGLDFNNSTGSKINVFSIHSPEGAAAGSFLFDNLIIQDEAIEPTDFHPFGNCWDLAYDYEESLDLPPDHIVAAAYVTDVFVEYSAFCDNNSLAIIDSSILASTKVGISFEDVSDIVHVQLTVEALKDEGSIHFDLGEGENSVLNEVWDDFESNTKYSLQIIADNRAKTYDFIVNADTAKDISFDDGTAGSIDNFTMFSPLESAGDFRIDNLAISSYALPELVFPFDDCVEPVTGLILRDVLSRGIDLYPNPTSGLVYIEFEQAHSGPITVTDLYGREIYRAKGTGDMLLEMDLSMNAPGIYLINFHDEQGRFTRIIQLIK